MDRRAHAALPRLRGGGVPSRRPLDVRGRAGRGTRPPRAHRRPRPALVVRAGETTIRVAKVPDFTPHPFTVLGWEIRDIDGIVGWLAQRGVAFEKYPWVQDKRGIWTTPGGDKVAWFKDPDGNVLSVSQHK